MIRQIIKIDEEKCNGCGICAEACHEGAIAMIDGKAGLVRDDYCDGLGDCLPACPTGAITFETREAAEYDKEAAQKNMKQRKREPRQISVSQNGRELSESKGGHTGVLGVPAQSRLLNWPVQIKLAPVKAPYFDGARLLIAADCTAYAYGNFHDDMMRGKVTLIGCPKLDGIDYSEKLTEIIKNNEIQSVTVVRMEVPCCGGLEMAAKKALQASGKFIPWQIVTLSVEGKILD
ncbi:MAG: 4Fe-4S binding protein [Lachnospiraceae bacterium]|nr:4Fe-4S binding protein [Lachnospiraceae bacterium]